MQHNQKQQFSRKSFRKIVSTDDSEQMHINLNGGLLKNLPTGGNSILERRKLKTGFSLNPIQTKLQINKISTADVNKLLDEMKAKVSTCDTQSTSSHSHGDAEYIFVNPSTSSPKPKSKKELMIDSCLNSLKIFQVNISVALNEYKF